MAASSDASDSRESLPTLPAGTPLTFSSLNTVIGEPGGVFRIVDPTPPGNVLDGKYQVLEVKGGPGLSGMGIVYITDAGDTRYAAKTFQHQFSQNLDLVERFLREARTWILTGFHVNIVHAYFIDIIGATPYLFMEYVEPDSQGRLSLADHLRDGPLDMMEAVRLAIQCCDGMIHATSSVPGLVHRDLKPENLLISRDGILKITDFGLVRCNIAEEISTPDAAALPQLSSLTQMGTTFGTPAYMAPEQFVEAGAVGEAADIYAFGCCFYEAICGGRLFTIRADTAIEHLLALQRFHQHEPPVPLLERAAHCPQDLDRVIMRCLEKNPAHRWQSFRELGGELRSVLENAFNHTFTAPPSQHPSAHQVASQIRSLTLLDGYRRAVRLRNLRENQDASPYAFHLALASYFHCSGEPEEERRQLEKAMRVRGPQQGYEAVRRLGELLVESGELDQAGCLLDRFLTEEPESLDRCLEPYVFLCVARGAFPLAEELISRFPRSRRTEALLARIYRASNRDAELIALYEAQIVDILGTIRENLASVEPGDRVGWEHDGDMNTFCEVIKILAPDCHLDVLQRVSHTAWPDLEAYPDFSGEMAWLSEALGALAEIDTFPDAKRREIYRECGRRLGYPDRLQRHLIRDETWFWTADDNEAQNASFST
ncbi:MAG: protein kinase [Candidatus Hydrogenedentes bacterium]|nr:protein kinase [Candidatus Hydrogenedentota bacterium]